MLKLKISIVVLTAFAGLNIAFKPANNTPPSFGRFIFFDKNDTVRLARGDYKLLRDEVKFPWISVTNKLKADSIWQLTKPEIEFYIDGVKFKASGIDVISSAVPTGADYFFPLIHGKMKLFPSQDNSIALSSVRR